MMPSLATMRLFIFSRLYCRGGIERAELSLWLRREMELRDQRAALAALPRRARTFLSPGGDA